MPSRQPAHPLNRYAPISEYQSGPCAEFATVLADPDSHCLGKVYETIASYSDEVWKTAYRHRMQSAESTEIEIISWQKALAAALRSHQHRSPDATARNIYQLGTTLHHWPLRIDQPSILHIVAIANNQFGWPIRLAHLECLCPVLRSHFVGMTAEEHEATYELNRQQTGKLLSVAIDNSLSPKQLANHINKLLGKPTAGRPRRG